MANAAALKARLAVVYDEEPARQTTPPLAAGRALPGGTFGTRVSDVKTIVIHETSGYPARNRTSDFVGRYIEPTHELRGFGPQFYVSSDGTVARLVGERLITWHATFLNLQSLGIEQGHRNDRNAIVKNGVVLESWHQLSPDADDSIPGQRLYALRHRFDAPHEVLFCWFPTATFAGPRGSAAADSGMLFTEGEYRSLAALARYLAEMAFVPRNFPLLPWATREHDMEYPRTDTSSPRFRLIALADQRFAPLLTRLAPLGFDEPMFDRAALATFRTQYAAAMIADNSLGPIAEFQLKNHVNKRLNRAWLELFHEYRGFHGHGFAGSITHHDDHTTCPGALFDWHRFAREVWDWWWYPFDFNDSFFATSTIRRPYTASPAPGLDTPLIEYFFENTPTDDRPDPYAIRTNPPIAPIGGAGILSAASSPSVFRLDTGTPIYAMANGELVAARLMPAGPGVSMSFALVRHQVYHAPELIACVPVLDSLGALGIPADPAPGTTSGRIDYDVAPTTVFSLYMHLASTDQMNFDAVVAGNPDWLNRVLIRKKECDLAIDETGALHPALAAMPAAEFTTPPPIAASRPNPIDLLRVDQARLSTFMAALRRGDVATAPVQSGLQVIGPTPINIVLGDFLGFAGVIRSTAGQTLQGIAVEVFSRDPIAPLRTVGSLYQSEWARDLSASEQAMVQANGVANPALVKWWPAAIADQLVDTRLQPAAKLPANGQVVHYPPLDFLKWINDVTWTSEWPKYQMWSGSTMLPRPLRPRPRRVS